MELRENPKFQRAFTLIELLVVITVIAILMGLLFPAFRGVQDQAKRTQAKNDLTQIVTAVNAYYTEYGKYPLSTTSRGLIRSLAILAAARITETRTSSTHCEQSLSERTL